MSIYRVNYYPITEYNNLLLFSIYWNIWKRFLSTVFLLLLLLLLLFLLLLLLILLLSILWFYFFVFFIYVVGWNFNKGEQLFENYGQPNHIYFTYHGFSLPPKENSHDCVLFEFNLSPDEMSRVNWEAEHVRGIAQVSTYLLVFCFVLRNLLHASSFLNCFAYLNNMIGSDQSYMFTML